MLRQEILQGVVKPGERLRQVEIASRYGTSRIPVREALKQLHTEGLVSLLSHVGARVSTLNIAELNEIYLIRERVEPYAIHLSTPNLTDSDHRQLGELLTKMNASANVDDLGDWIELDRRFHLLTYAGMAMPRLMRIIESLWDSTQQYRRAYVGLPESLSIAHREHLLILAALERGSASDAERLSLAHIRRTRNGLGLHVDLFSGTEDG